MSRIREDLKFFLIGIFALALTYFLSLVIPPKISQGINDLSSWYSYIFSKKSLKPHKIIGIAVDDYSLNKISQRWSWKRSIYAQILRVLDQEKVNTVGIDFAFVGESSEAEDLQLTQALKDTTSSVVLPYFFDAQKNNFVLPLNQFKEAADDTGLLNTPLDADGKVRHLKQYLELNGKRYYSFSLVLAATYLKKSPQDLISRLPSSPGQTYSLSFLLLPKDITVLSFYDVLENMPLLKKQYGNTFLKGALVLIYPEAEILHDIYQTPLGRLAGGMLHLNGVADILSGRLLRDMPWLRLPFLLFSFALVLFILTECGFAAGALLSFGVIILEFWGLVFLHFRNLQFDYSYVVNFTILFFVLGSAYKYVFFLYQIVRIKYKATLDPLSNLFTLRYFYYRLLLEEKKIYFGRGLYLVFIHLESFTLALEELPLNVIKDWWRQASLVLGARGYLWSVYSNEEVVGCLVASEERARRTVNLLKVNLDALLVKRQIKSQVRIGYLRLKPNYPVAELLSFLSAELKLKKQTVVLFGPADLKPALAAAPDRLNAPLEMLSSLDADIEEKNQQLLSLIENLSKEHVKTKEAFFQIITSLVNALEARDAYTQGHSERVSRYSLMLAEKLDWSPEQKERLKKAALLHDLGKIGIPDSILHKRGSLTPEEYNIIKQHEVIGVKILQPLKDLSDILPWILHHHERWDGAGYPHGLAGDAIPEGAQVLSLADVFDALTTGRDYKPAFSIKDSLEEIIRNKGTQFNPRLADLFLETIQKSSLERRV